MNHSDKIEFLREDLRSRGFEKILGRVLNPPVYRLVWALGWKVAPPVFQNGLKRFFFNSLFVALIYLPLLGLISYLYPVVEFVPSIRPSVIIVGGIFLNGFSEASQYYDSQVRWNDYPELRY